jgi:hypothetical protein
MFRGARLCLANPMAAKLRRSSRLEKRHQRGSAPIPLEQSKKSFNDYIVRRAGPNPDAQRRLKGMMLSSNKNLRAADYSNRRMAMQTAGDANELAHDANFGVSPMDVLAHGHDVSEYVAPPASYTPLMARKMAEGRLWPTSNTPDFDRRVSEKEYVKHWENLMPSERIYSDEIEYWVRRNLRAAPAHLVEAIDLTELMIDRIIPDRRSRRLIVVWSSVTPELRYKMEPHVAELGPWIIRQVKERMRQRRYFIPHFVSFVYNTGHLKENLPKQLVKELSAVHMQMNATLSDRVAKLKAMDTVDARLKGVPWFMPYLWKKDQVVRNTKQSYQDLRTLEDRKTGKDSSAPQEWGKPNTYKF